MAAFGTYTLFDPFYTPPPKPVNEELVGEHLGEHPLIRSIRAKIHAYRCQSPGHFANEIAADIVSESLPPETPIGLTKDLRLKISFGNYHTNENRKCRPFFRKERLTKVVQVEVKKYRWVTLTSFLAMHFPPVQDLVSENTMRGWWDENGKTFRWAGLPKELKLKIVQNCVPNPKGFFPVYLTRKYKKVHLSKFGLYEMAGQLGDWYSLLHVSAEMRADTLRIILVHNDNCPGGLTIATKNLAWLKDTIDRLGWYYQMTEPNGVPVSREDERLARQYWSWPKVYPELSRFATMMHGIRRLHLKFDTYDALYFFKAPFGNRHPYRSDKILTCDVFQKLPNLNSFWFLLPQQMLFQTDCTRKVHRLIYERAAVELAPYAKFRITGFIDEEEVQRFQSLHESAVANLECGDLSDDENDGGILLHPEPETNSSTSLSSMQSILPSDSSTPKSLNDKFPPECECEVPCSEHFDVPQQMKYGYRAGKGPYQDSVWKSIS